MALIREPETCLICGELVPWKLLPRPSFGIGGEMFVGDEGGYYDYQNHQCRKGASTSQKQDVKNDGDAGGFLAAATDAVADIAGAAFENAGSAAETVGEVCSAIAEAAGDCL